MSNLERVSLANSQSLSFPFSFAGCKSTNSFLIIQIFLQNIFLFFLILPPLNPPNLNLPDHFLQLLLHYLKKRRAKILTLFLLTKYFGNYFSFFGNIFPTPCHVQNTRLCAAPNHALPEIKIAHHAIAHLF